MIVSRLMCAAIPVAAMSMAAMPASAQTVAAVMTPAPPPEIAPAPAPAPVPAVQHVTLNTAHGAIIIAVEVERAPISAANFLRYVDARRLDGVTFYRAMDLGRGYGLIQGGTRGAPRITYPAIAHEPTSRTGLSHVDGAISFARLAPGTASGDFFITIGALTSLDAQAQGSGGDTDGFAVFGRVLQGMDVVRAILAAPTDPNAGEGVMRGQMIAAPVRIVTARRSAVPVVETEAVPTP
ncbi:MAG: peptidylprolyl isomerase [Sphingopyxis sp.]